MKKITEMNQDELLNYARELEGRETGRTFEESAEYYRKNDVVETAELFDKMAARWWELEEKASKYWHHS